MPSDLSHTTIGALGKWITARHLTPDAIAAAHRAFNGRDERYVVLDDIMDPARLAQIRHLIQEEGEVRTAYKLYTESGWVDGDRFVQAPDEERFIHEHIYTGPKPGHAMSQPTLHDRLFRMFVGSRPFADFLSAITGLGIGALQNVNLKRLNADHFLRWHSDRSPGRALCMVIYLHDDWQPAYDGRLLMQRADGNGIDRIDPLFNRLVVFSPNVSTQHAVEPLSPAAAGWSRLNYSLWFSEPA
ncbi:2OG-Fe(II) oxygenase [Niveispirillum sp. KHB5.9]|uniref:2OG-Fe(II) oxygenase n=1 Tax=Niveispirillum sp. KHB5.9 TaxID=3400269 RepID=UPI003A859E04